MNQVEYDYKSKSVESLKMFNDEQLFYELERRKQEKRKKQDNVPIFRRTIELEIWQIMAISGTVTFCFLYLFGVF
jgi:hypothetical protein